MPFHRLTASALPGSRSAVLGRLSLTEARPSLSLGPEELAPDELDLQQLARRGGQNLHPILP